MLTVVLVVQRVRRSGMFFAHHHKLVAVLSIIFFGTLYQNNIMNNSRLARRGGVVRIKKEIYGEVRGIIMEQLSKVSLASLRR